MKGCGQDVKGFGVLGGCCSEEETKHFCCFEIETKCCFDGETKVLCYCGKEIRIDCEAVRD